MTYQFACCIATLWRFSANIRLHTFMLKYVLGWCSVILMVDTPWHPHCQFQSLPQMNCLHIHTITNISARVNNHMLIVIAIHPYNTWNNVQTCSNVGYIITDEWCWKRKQNIKNIMVSNNMTRCSAIAERLRCRVHYFWPKVEDWNSETIFYWHYTSVFNHCDIIGSKGSQK